MGFHFENIKEGRIDGITIQEMKLNGSVIWPSQAYTYNLYNIRVFDNTGQTNIINAGGTNRLYVLADVDVRSGTTTVKTITDIRLTPVSSPAPEIILSDKPYIKAESRGTVEGPERYTTVICQAYGHTVTVQVAQEANEIVQTTYDMSEATAVPSVYSTIPKEGGLVNIQYNARAAQKLTYTSGAEQTGQMQDMPLYLAAAPTYGDLILTQVQGGIGYAAITIPANLYTENRQWQFFLYEPISGARGAAATLTQSHETATSVLVLKVASVDPRTRRVTATVSLRSGTAPSGKVRLYGGRFGLIGHPEYDLPLDEDYYDVNLDEEFEVLTLPAPERDLSGNCYINDMIAEGYNISISATYVTIYAPGVWTYTIYSISAISSSETSYGQFLADGSARYHYTGTVREYRDGAYIRQFTGEPLAIPSAPVSPSGVLFYVENNEVWNESRGRVAGDAETISVHLLAERFGCEGDYRQTLQYNSHGGDTRDPSTVVFEYAGVGNIPQLGGVLNFNYDTTILVTEHWTSGVYVVPRYELLRFVDSMFSENPELNGTGVISINVKPNDFTEIRQHDLEIRIQGTFWTVIDTRYGYVQQDAYLTDVGINLSLSISSPWAVTLNSELVSGSGAISTYIIEFKVHVLPDGDSERVYEQALIESFTVGTPKILSLASQLDPGHNENGECWIEVPLGAYRVNVISTPHRRYEYIAPDEQ